jgi:hypothetical protein
MDQLVLLSPVRQRASALAQEAAAAEAEAAEPGTPFLQAPSFHSGRRSEAAVEVVAAAGKAALLRPVTHRGRFASAAA